jgi:hypothetical protein
MCRADHHDVDRGRFERGFRQHRLKRCDDAGRDVGGGPSFDAGEHFRAVHDDRVGVGAADVDAYSDHCLDSCNN